MLAAIHSSNDTVYFSDVKICSDPLLLTHFLSVCFRTPITMKQTSHRSSYIFRAASIILKWEQPLEAATFCQKYFFRTPSCLEELLLSNNYFLVTNTFSDQLLLEYKCFFSTATIMFQRSYFCRIQNIYFFDADSSSKELLFQKKNLFRSRCFLLHYIYIGKDFPLTITYSFKYTIGYTI